MDAGALKAFAHPVRLRMYELLEELGAATATQLAALIGENSGVTSYHLRQLAKHGLIVDVPERGTGKERFWRASGFSADLSELRDDPEAAQAADALAMSVFQQRGAEMARWADEAPSTPKEWIAATTHSRRGMRLTRQELAELGQQVLQVLDAFQERVAGRYTAEEAPADAERVIVHFDAFPVGVQQRPM